MTASKMRRVDAVRRKLMARKAAGGGDAARRRLEGAVERKTAPEGGGAGAGSGSTGGA